MRVSHKTGEWSNQKEEGTRERSRMEGEGRRREENVGKLGDGRWLII
jgi:hypothetical protein